MDPEQTFLEQLPLIERIIRCTCRRYRCGADEAEEFASIVKLQLVSDDYAVFRKFLGESSLATYLTIVIQRLFLDQRNRMWGRWRPSAEARRLGSVAEQLELLIGRDGHPVDEACEILRSRLRAPGATAEELRELAARLPRRTHVVRTDGEEVLAALPSREGGPDSGLDEKERDTMRQRVARVLDEALGQLADEDRLVVRLWVDDGLRTVEIARVLGVEAKPLYRRLAGILKDLRRRMEAAGVGLETVGEVLREEATGASSFRGQA